MGGYSLIATVAILTIAILPLIWITINLNMGTQTKLISTFQELKKMIQNRDQEDIEIIDNSINWTNNTEFTIQIRNIGKVGIHYKDFKYISIIIDYKSSNLRRIRYIPFIQYNTPEYWEVLSVYTEGYNKELANPYNQLNNTYTGIWDPKEIIVIKIHLDPAYPIDNSSTYSIIFSTPKGSYDIYRGVYQ